MNVATILKDKGATVHTARPGDSVLQVAARLAEKRIGAIVVTDDADQVVGIVSERDIIRQLGRTGPACLSGPVSDVMTRTVVSCSRADTIDRVMAMMTARRFRHLPVVEGGKLVGIVSIGDVVKLHIAEVEMEAEALKGYITAA